MRKKSIKDVKMCMEKGYFEQANVLEEKEMKHKNKNLGNMSKLISDDEVDASDEIMEWVNMKILNM